jgi:hypothetical protein
VEAGRFESEETSPSAAQLNIALKANRFEENQNPPGLVAGLLGLSRKGVMFLTGLIRQVVKALFAWRALLRLSASLEMASFEEVAHDYTARKRNSQSVELVIGWPSSWFWY